MCTPSADSPRIATETFGEAIDGRFETLRPELLLGLHQQPTSASGRAGGGRLLGSLNPRQRRIAPACGATIRRCFAGAPAADDHAVRFHM